MKKLKNLIIYDGYTIIEKKQIDKVGNVIFKQIITNINWIKQNEKKII